MMNLWKGTVRRVGATLLACVLLLGLLPQLPRQAGAAYTDSYLQQMVDWGFMRGDISGNLRPDNPISRAEFVTVINRALGYEKLGGDPFQDVPDSAWYAEDVDIAYTEGYISGTSKTTFSPDSSITREETAIILTRNLMLQPDTGENTSFTDSRELSEWSRGYIATAARYGLVNGYPDGSFRPKNQITRGEAAILVVKAVGTPVQTAGVHSLGSTWGNVTITSSGVTLRDTVVGGNLYITGGVDLGEITLENVTVLGEIVISGGGVSEGGDDSIVLRNVNAPKLIVDNIPNQQISIRVEGDGVIEHTSVRTDAYLDDRTPAGYGLSKIALEGEDGLSLNLAGNVKEVTNLTPKSRIGVASGHVDTINVDEKATDSTLNIASGAEVDNVNLDVATSVTGDGDIGHLTVNAPGSTVTMLPDQITIRPGYRLLGGHLGDRRLRGGGRFAQPLVLQPQDCQERHPEPARLQPAGQRQNQRPDLRRLLLPVRRLCGRAGGAEPAEGHLLYYAGQHRAQFRLRLPLYVQNHQHLRAGDDHGHQVLPAVLGGAAQGGVRPHGQRL